MCLSQISFVTLLRQDTLLFTWVQKASFFINCRSLSLKPAHTQDQFESCLTPYSVSQQGQSQCPMPDNKSLWLSCLGDPASCPNFCTFLSAYLSSGWCRKGKMMPVFSVHSFISSAIRASILTIEQLLMALVALFEIKITLITTSGLYYQNILPVLKTNAFCNVSAIFNVRTPKGLSTYF